MKVVILASGGDAPGMNACIHYLTKKLTCFKRNQVYVAKYGFKGLIDGNFERVTTKQTRKYKKKAGVFIKSSRCPEFRTQEGIDKAAKNVKENGFDVVFVLGGDGSYRGSIALMKKKVKVVFIPATIDRDLTYETYTIGFYTAVSACCQYIYDVEPTMHAFDRTCVYETMGRENASLPTLVSEIIDADLLITKENYNSINYDEFLKMHKENPVRTVVLQEKFIPIEEIVKKIKEVTGGSVRGCVISYVQRGTDPTKDELSKCKLFAKTAVKAMKKAEYSTAIGIDVNQGKYLKLS